MPEDMPRGPANADAPEFDLIATKDYYAVMVHFYRGELGRIMVWRQRLDVTTNWAIVGGTAMVTFGLGSREHTHLIFLFANFLIFLLLMIESRRYRYYDAFRARVRMLEAHFIMPVVLQQEKIRQGDWRRIMSEDLIIPTFKIDRWTAILRRYRRNYVWLFLILALAWITKIWLHYPSSHTFAGFLEALETNHPIPEWLFWPIFLLSYGVLIVLTITAFVSRSGSGEFSTKAMHGKKWRI